MEQTMTYDEAFNAIYEAITAENPYGLPLGPVLGSWVAEVAMEALSWPWSEEES